MLVLSRKLNQEILIGDGITVRVLKVKGNTVRLGIEAPKHVRVLRGELPPRKRIAEVTIVYSNEIDQPADFSAGQRVGEESAATPPRPSGKSLPIAPKLDGSRLKQLLAQLTR